MNQTTQNEILNRLEYIRLENSISEAVQFLVELSKEETKITKAGCAYLSRYVIPKLQTGIRNDKQMPAWVFEELFEERVPRPTSAQEWVDAFPGSAIVSFNDRIRGKEPLKHGRRLPDPQKAKERFTGLFMTPNAVSGINHLDEEITTLRFFFIDFDGGDKSGIREKIKQLPFIPSIITETAHGYHVYFRLRSNSVRVPEWKAVERRIVEKHGGDMASTNAARVLRIPFTWNCKEEPFEVKLIEWNNHKYDFLDFEIAYPETEKKVFYLQKTDYKPSIKQPPSAVLTQDHRHDGLMEWLKAAYWRIHEDETLAGDVRRRAKEWYSTGHTPQKPYWEKEVDDMCDWFEKRQWGHIVSR